MSLHSGWFWHTGDGPKSLDTLKSIYYSSVGRNSVLLLNVPPDNTGRLTAADVGRLGEFARWRSDVFGTDLARGWAALCFDEDANCIGAAEEAAAGGPRFVRFGFTVRSELFGQPGASQRFAALMVPPAVRPTNGD